MSIHTLCADKFRGLVNETKEDKSITLSRNATYHLSEALITHVRDEHLFIYPVSTFVRLTQKHGSPAVSFVINGDRCLLLVGLFSEVITNKRLRTNDYISMGRQYYAYAQAHEPSSLDTYYASIIDEFERMVYVLKSIRHPS